MKLPDVLIHHITPRKKVSLGGAYFHSTNEPARRWSIWAKVTPTGLNVSMGGIAPANIEIDLTDTEADALIDILMHAAALRRETQAQDKKAA